MNGTAVGASEGLIRLSLMTTPRTALPPTDCNDQPFLFQDLGHRQVAADFSGGCLSSDGGALLVRQVDRGLGVTRTLAQAFTDRRAQRPGVCRLGISDPQELASGSPRGGQGRSDGGRRQPTLRGDQPASGRLSWRRPATLQRRATLRGSVLRTRRDGKRAQATNPGPGGRPALDASPGEQSITALAGDPGVSVVGTVAERGVARQRTGGGDGGDDSHAALESGSERERECAARVGAVEFGLSVASVVSALRAATRVRGCGRAVARGEENHGTAGAPPGAREGCRQNWRKNVKIEPAQGATGGGAGTFSKTTTHRHHSIQKPSPACHFREPCEICGLASHEMGSQPAVLQRGTTKAESSARHAEDPKN